MTSSANELIVHAKLSLASDVTLRVGLFDLRAISVVLQVNSSGLCVCGVCVPSMKASMIVPMSSYNIISFSSSTSEVSIIFSIFWQK